MLTLRAPLLRRAIRATRLFPTTRALWRVAALASVVVVAPACLEAPGIGAAAAPQEAESRAPVMGGSTNTELKRKLDILEGMLDGKLTVADVQKRVEKDFKDLSPTDRDEKMKELKETLEGLPQHLTTGKGMPLGPERDMVLARFYFSERRFIEAAELLSAVLDVRADFPEARNMLARCFFFLGNPDRTIQELEFRISQIETIRRTRTITDEEGLEYLEGLFLIGAAVLESPGTSRENLERGQRAWENYLQAAPESPQRPRVEEGLEELRAGLRGEGRLAQAPTVRSSAAMAAPVGVKGGASSFQGGDAAAGPAAKAGDRLQKLPADASPADRAIAGLLDALDGRDVAGAQKFLTDAEALVPGEPVVMVGKGRLFVQTGRIPDALQLFGEIIKRNPDYMPAWHYNGMAHMMGGDAGQAVESWETIKKRDPAYFDANNLGQRVEVARRMAQGR
jgi:tetratricopeptide (TPR) repeat protein